MTAAPVLSWCSSQSIDLPVHETCAALDWLCARAPGPPDRPGLWTYPTPTLAHMHFDRHTRTGPPDRPGYAPYRQLNGHLRRRAPWPLLVQLEVSPWDRRRSDLTLCPLFSRDLALSYFAAHGFAVLRDLALRLSEIAATHHERDLDDAALTVLLNVV